MDSRVNLSLWEAEVKDLRVCLTDLLELRSVVCLKLPKEVPHMGLYRIFRNLQQGGDHSWPVTIDYDIPAGKQNGVLFRVALVGSH
jgi:hypothetical protein